MSKVIIAALNNYRANQLNLTLPYSETWDLFASSNYINMIVLHMQYWYLEMLLEYYVMYRLKHVYND